MNTKEDTSREFLRCINVGQETPLSMYGYQLPRLLNLFQSGKIDYSSVVNPEVRINSDLKLLIDNLPELTGQIGDYDFLRDKQEVNLRKIADEYIANLNNGTTEH